MEALHNMSSQNAGLSMIQVDNSTNETCTDSCQQQCLFVPGNGTDILSCLVDTCGCAQYAEAEQ